MEQRVDNEEWMRFALASAGLGTWDLDPRNNQVIWDNRCRELYGYPGGAHISYEGVLKYIHPDDRELVIAHVNKALDKESGGSYDVSFRTVGAVDQRLRWLRCIGKAYFNEDN